MNITELQQQLQGELIENASLRNFNTWRIGGPAELLYLPADAKDFIQSLKLFPQDRAIHYLGLGSNVLIPDQGLAGITICLQNRLKQLAELEPGLIRAEAGVACAKLARTSARMAYQGGEFFAGIPGTIGGALAMNAGAFGGETWLCVHSLETVDRQGQVHERKPSDYQVSYRQVILPGDEAFVAATFKFDDGDADKAQARIRELLKTRTLTQPTGDFTCGSVFRNPPGDYAARLIESCGLKGFRIGDAEVSRKHANFIVNCKNASAKDVMLLIEHIKQTVFASYKIDLQPEVKFLGTF